MEGENNISEQPNPDVATEILDHSETQSSNSDRSEISKITADSAKTSVQISSISDGLSEKSSVHSSETNFLLNALPEVDTISITMSENQDNAPNPSGHLENKAESGPAQSQPAGPPDPTTMDFITAVQYGNAERVLNLIKLEEAKADQTDDEGICALHWAAINNRSEICRLLVQNGAFIDQIGGELAGSPLHWAVRQGCFLTVKVLLDLNASVEIKDGEGLTVFHIGSQTGNWPVLALLMAHTKGFHVDVRDEEGRTPLMHALMRSQLETVRVLCALGAKLHSQDNKLNSCLHWAVISNFAGGASQMLGYVLRHSATKRVGSSQAPNLLPHPIGLKRMEDLLLIQNSEKHTAIEYARISNNQGCIFAMESYIKMLPKPASACCSSTKCGLDSKGGAAGFQSSENLLSDTDDFSETASRADPKSLHSKLSSERSQISHNKILAVFDKISVRIFGDISLQKRSIIAYFLPTFCFFTAAALCSMSISIPAKLLLIPVIYFVIGLVSKHAVKSGAERFVPIGISCGIKIFGMLTAIFRLTHFMSLYMNLIWFVICPLTWYCLYRAVRSNPGFLESFDDKMDKDKAFEELKRDLLAYCDKENTPKWTIRICTTCMVKKPLRSKHCTENQIDKCCGRFDHYCPWIVNVVGYKNHPWFLNYLACVLLIIMWHTYAAFNYLNVTCNFVQAMQGDGPLEVLKCDPWDSLLLVEMSIFFIWVFLLLASQLYMNIVEGQTTNESINWKKHSGHGHSHGPKVTIHGEPEKPKEIPAAAKQYRALDTGMSVRFLDLYQLRRRNVDWTTVYDDSDLEREGLITFKGGSEFV